MTQGQSQIAGAVTGAVDATQPLVNAAIDAELAKLGTSLPPQYASLISTYGPVFLAMGEEKLKSWLALAISPATDAAYDAYYQLAQGLNNDQLVAEFASVHAGFGAANSANAARIAQDKSSAQALIESLIKIGLAALVAV